MKKWLKLKIVLIILVFLLVVCGGVFTIYIYDYYRADDEVSQYLESSTEVKVTYDDYYEFNTKSEIGIIFYPGAKVEAKAYAKLMYDLSLNGFNTYLVSMPFNLAFLGMNEADKVIYDNPQIKKWYVMGHSLGGAMIANYASQNRDKIQGVILLAAYSTADLKSLNVLSIYGENDLVLNKAKYQEKKVNLPENFAEVIISGGNHAGFGMYGFQAGDGKLLISNEEQIQITINAIKAFILN